MMDVLRPGASSHGTYLGYFDDGERSRRVEEGLGWAVIEGSCGRVTGTLLFLIFSLFFYFSYYSCYPLCLRLILVTLLGRPTYQAILASTRSSQDSESPCHL